MKPITDDQVAALPLDRGRTQLLDAIVTAGQQVSGQQVSGQQVSDQQAATRRRPWRAGLAVAAAAAAVAAIAAGPLLLDRDATDRDAPSANDSAPIASSAAPAFSDLVPTLATVPSGWSKGHLGTKPIPSVSTERRIATDEGPAALGFSVERRPAAEYTSIVAGQTSQGGEPAGTIEVAGHTADLWTLTEKAGSGTGPCADPAKCVRHWSAITRVEDGEFLHVIGSGFSAGTMTEEEFRSLVARVRLVPPATRP